MPIDLICLDADDTLWHNMWLFVAAEQALLAMLAPFTDTGVALETLTACEARNLPLYGYGAKGFTLSMIETALELGGDALPAKVMREMLAAGRDLLAHPVELLDGIETTLDALAARGRLVRVTKGDLLHQEAKLAASGLGDQFAGIEIVSNKTPAIFKRVFARYDVRPAQAVMAGDSMRSDVLPAIETGGWVAYIPQPLVWDHEYALAPASHTRFAQLRSLGELPEWIDMIGRGDASSLAIRRNKRHIRRRRFVDAVFRGCQCRPAGELW